MILSKTCLKIELITEWKQVQNPNITFIEKEKVLVYSYSHIIKFIVTVSNMDHYKTE